MERFGWKINRNLLFSLAFCFIIHSTLLFLEVYTRTYDAFTHIFFAAHYAENWFDPWNYKWYTGFAQTSYPPLAHQLIALVSLVSSYKLAYSVVQLFSILLLPIGIYRFSKIWTDDVSAGYASLLMVFSSSLAIVVYVFGQLPMTLSIGFLINAVPYIYNWVKEGKFHDYLLGFAFMAVTTAAHHVTTIFGSFFFILPVMLLTLVDPLFQREEKKSFFYSGNLDFSSFMTILRFRLGKVKPYIKRSFYFSLPLLISIFIIILPYWTLIKGDPITQVPIPHASRDNFFINFNAAIVFWILPYGLLIFTMPYVIYKGFTNLKYTILFISWASLLILGTGGTTPIPKWILGRAFDVLTLDRFTIWASFIMLPFVGLMVKDMLEGRLRTYFEIELGAIGAKLFYLIAIFLFLILFGLNCSLTHYRKFQVNPIDMNPIVNFLAKDQHDRYRYLTLGFGDQMTWLSTLTDAATVDGNYNSIRNLPELTSTIVEKIDGAKYWGTGGIGSLVSFVTHPEIYNLKYIFVNDAFYNPLLHFAGWDYLGRLENGISVWDRKEIPPLPSILPRGKIEHWQALMWATVPVGTFVFLIGSLFYVGVMRRKGLS
ncbi:hypothetical protein KKC59_01060 [bacterium]|nr:hypothetical protein [bacterium]